MASLITRSEDVAPEKLAEMVTLAKTGLTPTEIGIRTGSTTRAVTCSVGRYFSENPDDYLEYLSNALRRRVDSIIPDEGQRTAVLSMLGEGRRPKEVAAATGITTSMVARFLKAQRAAERNNREMQELVSSRRS